MLIKIEKVNVEISCDCFYNENNVQKSNLCASSRRSFDPGILRKVGTIIWKMAITEVMIRITETTKTAAVETAAARTTETARW